MRPSATRPVVLVTGTSSGIGRETVLALRRAGAFVVATARDPADCQDLVEPGSCEVRRLDVADAAACAEVMRAVVAAHGRLDGLVNNAGYGATLAAEETSDATFRAMLEVNLVAPLRLARLALPTMRAQGHGRIVNVGSIAGRVGSPMLGPYSATKFGLRGLTQALHVEVRPFGVRALLVEPGVIRTNFGKRSAAEADKDVTDRAASPYAPLYRRWARMRGNPRGADPRVIARRIVRACLAANPPFHAYAPMHAKATNLASRLLPDSLLNALMRLYLWR